MKHTTVAAGDGYPLSAHAFGDAHSARAGVLIVPAMGVEQQYYAAFAQWLAARGCFVVTFDYRGMGHSRRGPLRRLQADVLTWAEQDTAAVLVFVREQVGDRPLLWIGHSLGGQIFGLVPGHEQVRALVTVAAGAGYWKEYVPKLRRIAPLLWFVLEQWRSWCLNPQYLFGVLPVRVREHYATLQLPLLSLSFTDDEYLSERNIESLHRYFAAAAREMRRVSPEDAGVPRIGHFGFFRKRFEKSLWPQVGEWLDRRVRPVH
jgi:predicted alpha/beta hydrolase